MNSTPQSGYRQPDGNEVDHELLEILYTNLPKSMVAVIAVATLFIPIVWQQTNHLTVLSWWGLISGLSIGRIALALYRQRFPEQFSHTAWRRWLFWGAMLTAVLWASATPLFFNGSPREVQIAIGLVLAGISAGAITSLAANIRLILFYVYLLIAPLSIALFLDGSTLYISIAVMTLVYLAMITVTALEYHRSLLESIQQRFELKNAHEQLLYKEDEARRLFEHTPTGLFYFDKALHLLSCNQAFAETLETERTSLIGLDMNQLPDQRILPALRASVLEGERGHYQGSYHTLFSKRELWGDIHSAPLYDKDHQIIGGIGAIQDRTREHLAQQKITRLALYDVLTSLPNRKLLTERIDQSIHHADRTGQLAALLFLDLDDFKRINDSYGHAQGDQLLVEFSERVRNALRDEDTVARLGGDEFVVLAIELGKSPDDAMRHGLRVADKIHSLCAEPFQGGEHSLFTSASVGLVLIESGLDANELLRRADTAMYRAKVQGKGQTAFYDAAMDKAAQIYAHTVHRLRLALAEGAFDLHFQPIVRISDNQTVAAEALIRWHDAELGPVSPAEFIPIAEDANLIRTLGQWVLNEACRQWATWERSGGKHHIEYLSINVSPRELSEADYIDTLCATLSRHGVSHQHIRLELTESILAENLEQLRSTLLQLRKLDIHCIIDDFGTGYSSLSYLKQLPVSTLKIDRDFVQGVVDDPDAVALIRVMIEIAEQFNYTVVAEGVETEEQRLALARVSPEIHYQGYLFSPALAASEFQVRILEH